MLLAPTANRTVDTATLGTDDFTLGGAGGTGVTIASVAPTRLPGTNVFRYYLEGDFALGEVIVAFPLGSWRDSAGPSAASEGRFTVVAPRATVSAPFNGRTAVDVAVLDADRDLTVATPRPLYLDVQFSAPPGSGLDYASILDAGDEFTVAAAATGGPLHFGGTPVPIAMVPDETTGVLVPTVVAKNGGESDADFFVRLTNEGVNRFRYRADAAAVAWAPGTVVVDFLAFDAGTGAGWRDSRGNVGLDTVDDLSVRVEGATANTTDPANGSGIDVSALNGRNYLDVTFPAPPQGFVLDFESITDFGAEFRLGGPGLGDVVLDTRQAPVVLHEGARQVRYWLGGTFAGDDVSLTFLPATWAYRALPGTVAAPDLVADLAEPGFLNVTFPAAPAGFTIDPASIADVAPEFVLTLATDPAYGQAVQTIPVTSGQTTLSVTFPTGGHAIDPGSVTDAAAEFTPGGAGLGTAVLGAPVHTTGATFTYDVVAGAFADGDLVVVLVPGSWSQADSTAAAGASPLVTALSGQTTRGTIDVDFRVPAGFLLDPRSILDGDPGIAVSGGATLTAQPPSQVGPRTFRFEVTTTSPIPAGTLATVTFTPSAWSFAAKTVQADPTRTPSVTQTGDVRYPIAGDGLGLGDAVMIDVPFPVAAGFTLDPTSLADFDELTLGGAGLGTVAIDHGTAPVVLADGTTVRYRITGAFAPTGAVTAEFTRGTWSVLDAVGDASVDSGSPFTATLGSTGDADPAFIATVVTVEFLDGAWSFVDPAGPLMTQNLGQAPLASYVDITFPTPPGGLVMDVASVTDPGDEFVLSGDALSGGASITGTPEYRGGTTFRYALTQPLAEGELTVTFTTGTWSLIDPVLEPASANLGDHAGDAFVDVQLPEHPSGLAVDAGTVTDAEPEFALSGAGLGGSTVTGTPVLQPGGTAASPIYRYTLSQALVAGDVIVSFTPGAWSLVADDSGAPVLSFTGDERVDFVDVTFPAHPSGLALDPASILDAAPEFTLGGPGAGSAALTGAAPTPVGGSTYRYTLTQALQAGAVVATFIAGSWSLLDAEGDDVTVTLGDVDDPNAGFIVIEDVPIAIDVPFPDVATGFHLDVTSLAFSGSPLAVSEFVLGGAGLGTVAVDPGVAPELLPDGRTVRWRKLFRSDHLPDRGRLRGHRRRHRDLHARHVVGDRDRDVRDHDGPGRAGRHDHAGRRGPGPRVHALRRVDRHSVPGGRGLPARPGHARGLRRVHAGRRRPRVGGDRHDGGAAGARRRHDRPLPHPRRVREHGRGHRHLRPRHVVDLRPGRRGGHAQPERPRSRAEADPHQRADVRRRHVPADGGRHAGPGHHRRRRVHLRWRGGGRRRVRRAVAARPGRRPLPLLPARRLRHGRGRRRVPGRRVRDPGRRHEPGRDGGLHGPRPDRRPRGARRRRRQRRARAERPRLPRRRHRGAGRDDARRGVGRGPRSRVHADRDLLGPGRARQHAGAAAAPPAGHHLRVPVLDARHLRGRRRHGHVPHRERRARLRRH